MAPFVNLNGREGHCVPKSACQTVGEAGSSRKMSVSNSAGLDLSDLNAIFEDQIGIYLHLKAGAGKLKVSFLRNLRNPAPPDSIINKNIIKKFKFEKISESRPGVESTVTLSLHHPHQGNPIIEQFRIVDDPHIHIQLSPAALERVRQLWRLDEGWLAILRLCKPQSGGTFFFASKTVLSSQYLDLPVLEKPVQNRVATLLVRAK